MNLQELKKKNPAELISEAENLGIENPSTLRKQEILFAILKKLAEKNEQITATGVLEVLQDGFGFLRAIESNYLPGPDDIYVSPSQIRRFGLRTGDSVEGEIRAPKDAERYFALLKVNKINFDEPEKGKNKIAFDNLTPLYPNSRIKLEVETNKIEKTRYIKGVIIKDTPRFKWRGMHLDVARHMFSVEFIKRYIDIIAMHKMNVFHWHLTEDQGWRIPIEKFPKLETISAWRKETLIGHYSDKPQKFDGKRYGGFYPKNEITDIIKYAKDRFVEIVPEIEMPGHATAALSAYPELSCTGGPHETETTWGVHKEVFCAGNEETFYFLEKILEEVSQIFPGPYIHIGGDECPKTRWKTCEKCQKELRMKI